MSRASEYWIHQQLEPDDIIIRGNSKRWSGRQIVHNIHDAEIRLSDAEIREIEIREDEYLKSKGIY